MFKSLLLHFLVSYFPEGVFAKHEIQMNTRFGPVVGKLADINSSTDLDAIGQKAWRVRHYFIIILGSAEKYSYVTLLAECYQ